ncbi:MAG: PEP/pyruvate-binding domain-containing protein [Pseudomonadota bacterium]
MTMTSTAATRQQPILWFTELGIHDRPVAGGKGASLGEMTCAGLPIPSGFVVSTIAFNQWLQDLDHKHAIRARITGLDKDDLPAIQQCTAELRALIEHEPLSRQLHDTIACNYAELGTTHPVAVRSSATSEDSAEASFAGLQDTYLWVKTEAELISKIRSCWASLYSPESVSYRLRLNVPEAQLAMAVVVQRMVNSRCSGVMFTRSPTTGDRSVITIEGSWGLGSAIVSGEVTPDRFVINKVTRDIRTRVVADKAMEHIPAESGGVLEQEVSDERRKQCCLSDEQIHALVALGKKVEQHYGSPQDIEWALDQDGNILLLQSRPETVWASKERAAVAKPAARAFDHIFNVMGGVKK